MSRCLAQVCAPAAECPLTEGKPHTLTPLNQCWFGDGPDGVKALLVSALNRATQVEGHLPALDLLFPFLYGIALLRELMVDLDDPGSSVPSGLDCGAAADHHDG